MNNLHEFGGVCDVIIKCNSERAIGEKTYKAGEPYTILKDVYVNIGYQNTTSEGSAKNNIYAHRSGSPDTISISGLTLTDKVSNLIATKIQQSVVTKYCECIADKNTIYMPEPYIKNSVYIYYNGEKINCKEQDDCLTGNFTNGYIYTIFYSVAVTQHCYDFTVPSYGYFSLDIIGKGNTNKKSNNIFISCPAVSLVSVPVFNLVNGTILNAPLQFTVIDKNQKPATFTFGE